MKEKALELLTIAEVTIVLGATASLLFAFSHTIGDDRPGIMMVAGLFIGIFWRPKKAVSPVGLRALVGILGALLGYGGLVLALYLLHVKVAGV